MSNLILYLVGFFSISTMSFAAEFNFTAIDICETKYGSCVAGLSNQTAFSNCTTSFDTCLKTTGYSSATEPLECFRSRAGWKIFYWSIGASVMFIAATFLLMPAIVKGLARCVNMVTERQKERYGDVKCLGNCLLCFTDNNGDGKVEPQELVQPSTIFGAISFVSPLVTWQSAVALQAECDYARTKKPD